MEALIIGASGLTGGILLDLLIKDEKYTSINLISRRPTKLQHPKIKETLVDFTKLESFSNSFQGDHLFCWIGTTKKKTPNQDDYKKIDIDIPVNAAKICKEQRIETFAVISAIGANHESKIFYNRTKGEMEQGILNQNIKNTIIVRPSLITGPRKEQRLLEKIGSFLFKALQFLFIGPFRKYRAIEAKSIAKSMIFLAKNPSKQHFFESIELETISRKTAQ